MTEPVILVSDLVKRYGDVEAVRGIGFEDVVFHMERGDLLDILEHPNPSRYAGQRIFVIRGEGFVYLVPFVEDEHTIFLKTIIPSREATSTTVAARQPPSISITDHRRHFLQIDSRAPIIML